MADFILSIDQGTTGSTSLIIDVSEKEAPKVIGRSTVDFQQYFPKSGWVEHSLDEIWASVAKATKRAIDLAQAKCSSFSVDKIRTLGITNQRETLCVYDRESLAPLYNAIVWQCRRSTDICKRMKADGLEGLFIEKTGLVLDPYFSGTKLAWLTENVEGIASALSSGKAAVGTVDTFLIAKLTGGGVHVTEASNACRTLMYNIHKGEWDDDLIKALNLPGKQGFAEVKDSSSHFGRTKDTGFLPDGIPICGVLGDQQAAMVGQACFEKGEAKCTYGTGAFLLVNTGSQAVKSNNGLLTTVAWQLDGVTTYALEGATFVAGAAVQFVRDQFGIINHSHESELLAESGRGSPDLFFVPALAGLGSPHWDPNARGALLGMTRGTQKQDIVRATLEGIAFSVAELTHAMESDLGEKFIGMAVDGGASANNILMQFQADILNVPLDRPKNLETTAFGAAMFAALGCGLYNSLEAIKISRESDKMFKTSIDEGERQNHKDHWQKAVGAVKYFSSS